MFENNDDTLNITELLEKTVTEQLSLWISLQEFKSIPIGYNKIIKSILQSFEDSNSEPNYCKQQYSKTEYLKHNKNI